VDPAHRRVHLAGACFIAERVHSDESLPIEIVL
jgi:hypothetical protein